MDKHTLKANALAAMRATIAHEWSAFLLNAQVQKNEGVARDMYKDSISLIQIEIEHEMKTCYKNLKELFDG
jgi:ParB-like chromosome segregation protein Spo0J